MLPFIDPENDIYTNLLVLLLLINTLEKTKQGTLKLNNSKLHIFLYLLKNPMMLNKTLSTLGKDIVILQDRDAYSITSISQNIDPLFDRKALKSLLKILISKKMVLVTYKKSDGFFYSISETGKNSLLAVNNEYFIEIKKYCEKLKPLLNSAETQLNKIINETIKREAI